MATPTGLNPARLKLQYEGVTANVKARVPSRAVKRALSEIDEEFERRRLKMTLATPDEVMEGDEQTAARYLKDLATSAKGIDAVYEVAGMQNVLGALLDITQLRRAQAIIDPESIPEDCKIREMILAPIDLDSDADETAFWDAQNFEEIVAFIAHFRKRLA